MTPAGMYRVVLTVDGQEFSQSLKIEGDATPGGGFFGSEEGDEEEEERRNMYAVGTECLDPRKPLELKASHPVGELYSNHPWLRDLPEVRVLFRLTLAVYGDRIDRSIGIFGREPDRTEQAQAMMFFRNIPTEVTVGPERISLHDLYQEAIRIIAVTSQPPKVKIEGLEAFIRAHARTLKNAFLVHGEPDAAEALATWVRDTTMARTLVPGLGQEVGI